MKKVKSLLEWKSKIEKQIVDESALEKIKGKSGDFTYITPILEP